MLLTGVLPRYTDLPLWALKDVGLFMWGFGVAKRDMWRKPSDYYLKEDLRFFYWPDTAVETRVLRVLMGDKSTERLSYCAMRL